MIAPTVPLFRDVWFQAKREGQAIDAVVLMADDSIKAVRFGPRGGWRYSRQTLQESTALRKNVIDTWQGICEKGSSKHRREPRQ